MYNKSDTKKTSRNQPGSLGSMALAVPILSWLAALLCMAATLRSANALTVRV